MKHDKIAKVISPHPHHHIEVELGDHKQPDIFYPQFKTKHWNNEVNFSVRLKDDDHAGAHVHHDGKTTHWKRGGRTARFYQKDTEDENGGFEFEVELDKKPESNVLEFSVQSKGLDFFYQPHEVDQKDLDMGAQPRADKVKGSYAVYHKEQNGDQTQINGKNYKSGKAFHIYRPYVVDANGKQEWCEMNIDEAAENLTITIPQEFLDSAAFPIIVDPTFGYTTNGASGDYNNNLYLFGSYFTCPNSVGTGSSFSEVIQTTGAVQYYYQVVYDNAGNRAGYTGSNAMADAAGAYWKTNNFAAGNIPALTGQQYWLGYYTANSGVTFQHYDVGATNQGAYHYVGGTYGVPPATLGSVNLQTWKRTVYVTYTVPTPQINVSDTVSMTDVATDVVRDNTRDVNIYENLWIPYGETFKLYPSDSTFVGSAYSTGPYNDLSTTMNYGGWGDWYYSFMHFDTSQAPPASQVTSAVFWAYNNSATTADAGNQVDANASAWNAHLESYALLLAGTPSRYAVMEGTFPSSTSTGWQSVDVTRLYLAWLNGSEVNYGFRIRPQFNNNTSGSFSSIYGANPPYILITLANETTDVTVDNTRNLSVSDSSTASESNTQTNLLLPVVAGEDVVVSEGTQIANSLGIANVYDLIISDDTTGMGSITSDLVISVGDDITITQDITTASGPQMTDVITLSESVTALIDMLPFETSDTVTITESVGAEIMLSISVGDDIVVSENTATEYIYNVSAVDTITFSESLTGMLDLYLLSLNDVIFVVDSQLNQQFTNNFYAPVEGGAGVTGGYQEVAQSFVAMGTSLDSFSLRIYKVGSPTDIYTFSIVSALDGTSLGDMTVLSSGVVSGNVLTSNTLSIPVTDGATYYIQGSRAGARDTANYLGLGVNVGNNASTVQNGDVYPYGSTWLRNNGSWAAQPTWDLYFKLNFSGLQTVTFETKTVNVTDFLVVEDAGPGTNFTLTASQDTYYGTSFLPGPNNTDTVMHVGGWGDHYYDFIQFDLTGITSVGSAKLILTQVGTPTNSPLPRAYKIASSWNEATLTRTLNPSYYTLAHISDFYPAWQNANTKQYADLSNVMYEWLTTGANYGVTLRDTYNTDSNTSIASTRAADSSTWPTLIVSPGIAATVSDLSVNVYDDLLLLSGPIGGNITSQGANAPTATVDDATVGTVAWVNPNNAQASDGVYTSMAGAINATLDSHYLKASGYGFNIPAGATILGIQINNQRYSNYSAGTCGVRDLNVKIIKSNGTLGTTNKADLVTVWPLAEAYATYGGSSDLWGETWTSSDINNANFGVAISVESQGFCGGSVFPTAYIDFVSITVTYRTLDEVQAQADTGPVSIFDSITATESVADAGTLDVNVFDALTITEVSLSEVFSEISISDSLTITESTTVTNPGSATSVFDSVTLSENITTSVTDVENESDTITITELVTAVTTTGGVSVSDSLTISESTTMAGGVSVSVADTITITEAVSTYETTQVSVVDPITISESVSIEQLSFLSVSDAITLTEVTQVTNSSGYSSVFDTLTVSEFVSAVTSGESENGSDTITITESVTATLALPGISIFDSVSITELVNNAGSLSLSVSDAIALTEAVSNSGSGTISVSDSIVISENVSTVEFSSVSVSDAIAVSENTQVTNPQLLASIADTITITENTVPNETQAGTESDVITITDVVTVSTQTGPVSVYDSLSITELVTVVNGGSGISVSDTMTIGESVSITGLEYDNESDTITITDVVTVSVLLPDLSIFDTVTLSESVSTSGISSLNVYDSVSVLEQITSVASSLSLFWVDFITFSESVSVIIDLAPISVSDTISLLEVIGSDVFSSVSVVDWITLSEHVKTDTHKFSPQDINKIPRGHGMSGSTIVRTTAYGGMLR